MEKTYVISGGPGTGKSTLCDRLAKRGFAVVPEAARQIIAQEKEKPEGVLPWTDLYGFQTLVYHRQIQNEDAVQEPIRFCDRSIIDNIGYCTLGNIPLPHGLEEESRKRQYSQVFILDILPTYQTDNERVEPIEVGRQIHTYIIAAYQRMGFTPTFIPAFSHLEREASIEARVDRILQTIGGQPWADVMIQDSDIEKSNKQYLQPTR